MLAGHNDARVHIKQQKITMQKNSVPVLAALITTGVEVKCPSCGKTGFARPASDKRTTTSVVGGFIEAAASQFDPDNLLKLSSYGLPSRRSSDPASLGLKSDPTHETSLRPI
jgi:hypothetical protein